MSDEYIWDEQEPFNDVPDEVKVDANGLQGSAPPVHLQRSKSTVAHVAPAASVAPMQTEDVSIGIVSNSDLEVEDYEDAMADAHLRLEQGSLYKMIMNHELFEGMDADPKAIQNVQNEMRNFARERMEIMLGMRQAATAAMYLETEFPFNALEVQVLKRLASAATKGASENAESFVPEVKRTDAPRKTLNTIGGSTAAKKIAVKAAAKPLQSKPATPVTRTKMDLTIDQIAREEGIPRELLEENIPGVGGKKLVHQMTEEEIIERNKLVSQRRGKQVRSGSSIPMATEQQQEMLAQNQAGSVIGTSNLMKQLLEKVKTMPIKNP